MHNFWEWLHDNTCGDDTVFFRIAQPFIVECPCCSWYRGVGMGFVMGGVITWLV